MARNQSQHGERAGAGYERIGERVSIFMNGRVWYANWQEGPKQQRKSLRTRNHEVARQKARALEAELSGAVPRQAGTFDIAAAVQAYIDWQDSNDRAPKTMIKYRDVLTRFAAHCRDAGVRLGEVVHLTHDDLTLDGPTPVAHIRPKEVVPGVRPWRPKNGEQRAVPLSPRAVAMLRDLPRRRRWVIDRMEGTAATANLPANDRHILSYLKTVLAKLGLEGTNHKFRHSFCTIAVLAGVNFFTLRRWVGHIDEEALKIYVHIADEQAQVTMRQLAERRQAAGRAAKPARGRQGISKVSARSPRGGRGAGGGSAKFQQSHGGQK